MESFSEIAAPLHALTQKNARFCWDQRCQESLETLKERLTGSPLLALPRDVGDFVLDTDASEPAIGTVLSQIQDGKERVIGYFSRLYSETEKLLHH